MSAVGRPGRILVAAAVACQLPDLAAACFGDKKVIARTQMRLPVKGDPLAIRRPRRRIGISAFFDNFSHVGAIRITNVHLTSDALAARGIGDLFA